MVLSSIPAVLSSWKHVNILEGSLQGKAIPQLLHHSLKSRSLLLGSLVQHCNIKEKHAAWLEAHWLSAASNTYMFQDIYAFPSS